MNERSNVYDDYKYKDKVFEQYDKVDDGVENKANKCPKQEPSTTLITGNSMIRDNLHSWYGYISHYCSTSEVTDQHKPLSIILLVESNGCVNDNFDTDVFEDDYLNLIKVSAVFH